MNGPRRAALRDAFRRADIGIVQFVHEPLAALYAFVRGRDDSAEAIRALNKRNVLVVDWGGGTLDLTLCRIEGDRVTQLRNGGSAEVGGDRFDEAIRDEVIKRFSQRAGLDAVAEIHPEAKLRLLHDSETNKIALSDRPAASFYRPDFFRSPEMTLEYRLSREELDEITRPIVAAGMREVEALLDSVNIGPSQVAMCLMAGGMAAMPAIRGRLHELFGPQRVEVPQNAATLIAQGAAWIASDAQRLHLAKPIELQLARGSYLTLVKAGTEMPAEQEVKSQQIHMYCTDPSDGIAKFQFCTPTRPSRRPQVSEPRNSIGSLTIQVDERAAPFRERLELDVSIDDDLILETRARSSDVQDSDTATFHDLEFGIELPKTGESDTGPDQMPKVDVESAHETGGLSVRANVASETNDDLVPGEVLYKHKRGSFSRDRGGTIATADQVREHLYYQPCAVCGRSSSDPRCECSTEPRSRS